MGYLSAVDALNPKFTGKNRDNETALDWFEIRAMSSAQGRFQSVDPANAGVSLGNPQTWNAYSYVGNNPLSNTDPTGEGIFSILAGIGAGVATFFGTGGNAIAAIKVGVTVAGIGSGIEAGQPPTLGLGGTLNLGSFTGCGGPLGNCGGFGNDPWSENSGLGRVQDPGRFTIMNFNSIAHSKMTLGAALNAGFSIDAATDLAYAVVMVDFRPSLRVSGGTDAEHTHWHAMGGRTTSGIETCTAAYAGSVNTLREATERARSGDANGTALALHLIQDSYASGHRYQAWGGGLPSRAHIAGDMTGAAGYSEAHSATTRYLRALAAGGSMQAPEAYMYRPTCK